MEQHPGRLNASPATNLDLVEIPVNELLSRANSPADIYIRLSDQKFIRLIKSGDKHVHSIIEKYNKKEVQVFFIQRTAVSKFSENVVRDATLVVENPNIPDAEKVKFISSAANSVYRELEKIGFTQEAFDNAKFVTDSAVSVVKARSNLLKLLQSLDHNKDPFVKHSMGVSMVSVLVAQVMGWDSPKTLGKLALGAFLHDIGKMELPPEIRAKRYEDMNSEEKMMYREHPKTGVKILKNMEEFPPEILAIVLQHHENAQQTGFPDRLANHAIHPMAKIVAVADAFCEFIFRKNRKFDFKMGVEAIKYIEGEMEQPFDKEAFTALKKMLINGFNEATAA